MEIFFIAPVTPIQVRCTKTCVNGGVCNIVNNQQVCWCQLGYDGANCEIQGQDFFSRDSSYRKSSSSSSSFN